MYTEEYRTYPVFKSIFSVLQLMYGENLRMKRNALIRTIRNVLQNYSFIIAVWRDIYLSKGK